MLMTQALTLTHVDESSPNPGHVDESSPNPNPDHGIGPTDPNPRRNGEKSRLCGTLAVAFEATLVHGVGLVEQLGLGLIVCQLGLGKS